MSGSISYFYQNLPWNFITKYHEGVVMHKDGLMQRTFAYRAPDIDSAGANEIAFLAVRVNDFAKRLGSGWAFHLEAQRFQLQEYPAASFDALAPYLIDRERELTFNSEGRHFDSSYYITFTYKPPSENVKKLTNMFIQSGSEGGGELTIKQNVDFFVSESNNVAGLLAQNMILQPLNNEQTIIYLHSTVSLKRHWIRLPFTSILFDRILPDTDLINSMPMMLGEYYIPIVGVNDFPEESYPAILDSLNRALIEYRWVTRYICLDKEEGLKETQKKEKSHRGNKKTFLQTLAESTSGEAAATLNHGAGVKERDSISAGMEIEGDEASLGYLTTCVMVWDKDLKKAVKKANQIITIINSKGFTAKIENFNALESFKSMMPGQVYANYRALPVMSNTMSHVVPLSSVWSGIRENDHAFNVTGVNIPHLICATLEGTPFYLNLNVRDVGHSSIFGPTGAGKSTILGLLSMQFLKYPASLLIFFDKGRSCRQACLACGGYFYEPAAENESGVNFQPLRDLDDDTDVLNACDFIESCITVNGETVVPAMSTAIKTTIDMMKDIPKEDRTMTTFLQYCDYQDKSGRPIVKELLSVYSIGGKYGKIFDDKSSEISMDARFIAFEMEALMARGENCVVPALLYLFNTVEKKFDGRLTMLVLDEAWLFLKNEIFAGKIAEWLKVLRKKNVYVVFATQDVQDVAASPLKTTIIQQCLTKIFLADPSALSPAMLEVYREFGLADPEIELIAHAAMKRDYFYSSPAGRRLFQLSLDKLTLALIGTPDHAVLDDLESKYEPGSFLCEQILAAKGVNYKKLLDGGAPYDPVLIPRKQPTRKGVTPPLLPQPERTEQEAAKHGEVPASSNHIDKYSSFLDAVSSLPDRKKSNGQGRAAESIAEKFGVSVSTVYQARKVLKHGSRDITDALLNGDIPVKTAYKRMKSEKKLLEKEAG